MTRRGSTPRPDPDPAQGVAENGRQRVSVWSFPRPPRIEPEDREVEVRLGGELICRSAGAVRVLETSHPPGIYIPIADFAAGALERTPGSSFCEWKGAASYYDLVAGERREARAAWGYPAPTAGYEELAGRVSLYPGRAECTLGGEEVDPQPGSFYGGWITAEIAGPVKGPPGTEFW